MALVRLVYEGSIDDHPRPQPPRNSPLWRRFMFPTTMLALWLYEDGTVLERDHLPHPGETPPDDVVAAGCVFVVEEDDWRVYVLYLAGYDFEFLDGTPLVLGVYTEFYQARY